MEFWFMLLSMIGYALVIISVFYITTPKPHEPENDPTNRVGRITRVLVLASSALSLVGVLMVDPYAMPTGGSIGRWNLLLGIVQSLLFGGATIGAVIVLARIAILGRRRGLRKLGRVLAWFVGFHVLGQIVVSGYTFFVLPSIATGMLASQSAATSTSTSVGVGYATTVTIGGNTPGTSGQGTNAAGPAGSNAQTTSPAALPPGAGAVPATPVPAMGSFAGLAVFGCFSAIVTVGTFVLGLTVLVKYRNLLGSAITASVTSARCRPLPQHGPTV